MNMQIELIENDSIHNIDNPINKNGFETVPTNRSTKFEDYNIFELE